ncbi:MAG: CGNR zinc finger domain-containing protein [Euzebya sp.]
MDYGHYTTRTTKEAVGLCNALANNSGESGTEEQLRELLHRFDLQQGPLDTEGLRHLAHRLRRVFTEQDLDVRISVLNDLIALYQPQPSIVDHDDEGYHLHYVPPGAGDLRCVGASMTMALAAVMCDYGPSRLGVCPDCNDVFVDTTRNSRQRFCSKACANRVHVAEHRARSAASEAS